MRIADEQQYKIMVQVKSCWLRTEASPVGNRVLMGTVRPYGKAVYWLPEGPKVVS